MVGKSHRLNFAARCHPFGETELQPRVRCPRDADYLTSETWLRLGAKWRRCSRRWHQGRCDRADPAAHQLGDDEPAGMPRGAQAPTRLDAALAGAHQRDLGVGAEAKQLLSAAELVSHAPELGARGGHQQEEAAAVLLVGIGGGPRPFNLDVGQSRAQYPTKAGRCPGLYHSTLCAWTEPHETN